MRRFQAILAVSLLAASLTGCASTAQAFLPESRSELHHPPHVNAWTRFWAGMLFSGHSEWRDSDGTWHKYPTGCMWTTPCPAVLIRSVPHSATAPPRETPGRGDSGHILARPVARQHRSPPSQPHCKLSTTHHCSGPPGAALRPTGKLPIAG